MAAFQASGAVSILTLKNYFGGGSTNNSLSSYVLGQASWLQDKIVGSPNIKSAGGRGYAAGGQGGINTSNIGGVGTDGRVLQHTTIQAFDFASKQFTVVADTLPIGTQEAAGVSSSTKGYVCGGQWQTATGNTYVAITSIYSMSYITETIATPTGVLAVARAAAAGVSSSTRGYVTGGAGAGVYSQEIDGIDFASETSINPAAVISVLTSQQTPMNSPLKGYVAGGTTTVASTAGRNHIDALTFSSETVATLASSIGSQRYGGAGFENSTQGYVHSGFANGTVPKDFGTMKLEATKILYSTEGVTVLAALVTAAGGMGPGISSTTDGYAILGHGGGLATTGIVYGIGTISFATDTPSLLATAINPKNVTQVSLGMSKPTVSLTDLNVSLSNYYSTVPGSCGFIAGGFTTAPVTTISAIGLYSLFVRSSIAALGTGRTGNSGVSSKTKGYSGGGLSTSAQSSATNTLSALTFSTETVATLAGLAGTAFSAGGSIGNRNTGWFLGGTNVSSVNLTDIRYLTYATEAVSTESSVLLETTANVGSASSRDYGWLIGGYRASTTPTTTTSQFNYYTRVPASTSTFLSAARTSMSGLSSSYAVYFIGGTNSSGTPVNTLDRQTNASATLVTLTSSLGANFQSATFYTASVGYIVGGSNGQTMLSNVNFATETSGTTTGTLYNQNGAALQSNNL